MPRYISFPRTADFFTAREKANCTKQYNIYCWEKFISKFLPAKRGTFPRYRVQTSLFLRFWFELPLWRINHRNASIRHLSRAPFANFTLRVACSEITEDIVLIHPSRRKNLISPLRGAGSPGPSSTMASSTCDAFFTGISRRNRRLPVILCREDRVMRRRSSFASAPPIR